MALAKKFTQPMKYTGNYYGWWAGYKFKENLDYTTGRHTGVDYNWGAGHDDKGFVVHAIANGKVTYAKNAGGGFGNTIIIRHELDPKLRSMYKAKKYGYSRYLHLNDIKVKVGQTVKVGQLIGHVGNTGTHWSHLHLDLWTDKNGLGSHTQYHKDTQLDSYLDPYKVIERHKNEVEETMYKGKNATYWGKKYENCNTASKTKDATIKARDAKIKTLNKTITDLNKELTAALAENKIDDKKIAQLNADLAVANEALAEAQAELSEPVTLREALAVVGQWIKTTILRRK